MTYSVLKVLLNPNQPINLHGLKQQIGCLGAGYCSPFDACCVGIIADGFLIGQMTFLSPNQQSQRTVL